MFDRRNGTRKSPGALKENIRPRQRNFVCVRKSTTAASNMPKSLQQKAPYASLHPKIQPDLTRSHATRMPYCASTNREKTMQRRSFPFWKKPFLSKILHADKRWDLAKQNVSMNLTQTHRAVKDISSRDMSFHMHIFFIRRKQSLRRIIFIFSWLQSAKATWPQILCILHKETYHKLNFHAYIVKKMHGLHFFSKNPWQSSVFAVISLQLVIANYFFYSMVSIC